MSTLRDRWAGFWMARSGLSRFGRLATRLAAWGAPPYKGKRPLAHLNRRGYISPRAQMACRDVRLGAHCYVDDDVVVYDRGDGGHVSLGDGVHLYKGTIIELGQGGCVEIGAGSHIQPRCQFTAFLGSVRIGREVQVAPACAFYPYEHGIAAGAPIHKQPLHTRGDIVIGDGAWLGYGVIVLEGVTIGAGAVVGAGAVLVGESPSPERGILSMKLHADGSGAYDLWLPAPSSRNIPRITHEMLDKGLQYPKMNGKSVFRWATEKMPEVAEESLREAGMTIDDIDLFVPHQANMRINQFVAMKLNLPQEKIVHNIDRYGNTTAATIPIGLSESWAAGRLKEGTRVLLAAFGSGYTWAGAVMKWC